MRRAALAFAVLLLLMGMVQAVRIGLGNLAYVKAEHEVSAWHGDASQPTLVSIQRAESAIRSALRFAPDNPDALTLAAQIHGWKGFILARQQGNPALAASHYAETLDLLRQALRLRPAQAQTWALIAEYKTLLGERDKEWHLAKEKALEFGGADIKLVLRMTNL
ncbi:MAG: hypothetical protein VR73_05885 [Gammaproteobacteria bacterium BRH_c0]|nr:MAG: hypothetical protein VR73_05885 [Gammaproteobacteria bacterium BRH_c0]